MYYTVYKITNLINNKIYIGQHQTLDLNDTYMGSGKLIKAAIRKYGKVNFTKEVLGVFDTPEEMNAREKELVVIGEGSYNLSPGGTGFNTTIAKLGRQRANQVLLEKLGPNWKQEISARGKEAGIFRYKENLKDPAFRAKIKEGSERGVQAALSQEARDKRKATFAKNGHQQGSKNTQFGTVWITDGVSNAKVKNTDLIPDGWHKGRVIAGRTS